MKKRISVFTLSVFLLSLILGSMLGVYADTPDGTIIYQSNFGECSSLADANLIYDQGEISDVRFENGKLVLDNRDNTDQDVFLKFDPAVKLPDGVDRFTISWEHTYLEDTGSSRYLAMNFFYRDTDNYSGSWLRCESNLFTCDVKLDGSFTHYEDLGEFEAADFGVTGGAGVTHNSKLVYDKGTLTAYVDGIKIGSGINENEVAEGEFGFMVKVECGVVLDNFIIYTGTGDPVYPGTETEPEDSGTPETADNSESSVPVPAATKTGDDLSTILIIAGVAIIAGVVILKIRGKKNTTK